MGTLNHPAKITKFYLLKISAPIFLSNLAIPLVGIVDTGLMGNLSNEKFLVATSIATSVITMIFWSFGFLRMGTTGLVAQALGRGDYKDIYLTTLRNLIMAIFISIIIIFLKDFIIILIKNFFNLTEETSFLMEKYISIRIFSAPAEFLIYVLVGFYLGLQKTSISSVIITFFSLANILLSYFFVVYFNLEISGVALGTLLSAYLVVITFLVYTYFYIIKTLRIIPRFEKVFIFKKILKLFNINFDIFIRTVLLTFAFLWIPYQGSIIGEDYVAINAILIQFIALASFFLDSYAYSTESVVGFAVGRRVQKSFLLAVRNSFEISFITALIISFVYILFFKDIINIITNSDFLRFLSYGYAFWIVLIPPIASFCYQFDGIFLGASRSVELRNSMIISVILFLLISSYLVDQLGNHGLWFSLLLFMIVRSITLNFYFHRIMKKF